MTIVISAIPLSLRQMAGETPDDPTSGREDEFLSKSKWERFPILIMGTPDDPLLAVFSPRLADEAARDSGVQIETALPSGQVTPDSPAARAVFSAAIAS